MHLYNQLLDLCFFNLQLLRNLFIDLEKLTTSEPSTEVDK